MGASRRPFLYTDLMKKTLFAKSGFLALFFFGGVCPLCIPKIAAFASIIGITLIPGGSIVAKVLLHVVFLYVLYLSLCNYHKHRNLVPFLCTAAGSGFLLAFTYIHPKVVVLPNWTLYVSVLVLMTAFVLDFRSCKAHTLCTQECNCTQPQP